MWGRLATCAAVGYRRLPVADTGATLWVRPIANRPQLAKLPHGQVHLLAADHPRHGALVRRWGRRSRLPIRAQLGQFFEIRIPKWDRPSHFSGLSPPANRAPPPPPRQSAAA